MTTVLDVRSVRSVLLTVNHHHIYPCLLLACSEGSLVLPGQGSFSLSPALLPAAITNTRLGQRITLPSRDLIIQFIPHSGTDTPRIYRPVFTLISLYRPV